MPALLAYLFPGQGSQAVGMGRALVAAHPAAARLFEIASEHSGHPLLRYCSEGPLDLLSRTDILQPSIATVSLGCLLALRARGVEPDIVAGHSLGEFVALVAADVLSEESALRLVCERGKLMHAAARARPGLMTAVSEVAPEQIESALEAVASRGPVVIANYNSPRQTVLSGAAEAVQAAEQGLAALGARVVRLPVSGAWHSPLMAEANQKFRDLLAKIPFAPARRRLFLNVTGAEARDPELIRSQLEVQMVSPVRWTRSMEGVISAGATTFVEVGPGRVLRGLLRHIWTDYAAYGIFGVDGPVALDAFARRVGKVA